MDNVISDETHRAERHTDITSCFHSCPGRTDLFGWAHQT